MFGKKMIWCMVQVLGVWFAFALLATNEAMATPPVRGTPTVPPPSGGGRGEPQVDWPRIVGDAIRGMTEPGRRPSPPPIRPPIRGSRYPEPQIVEPRYVQPRYVEPRYVEPPVVSNVIPRTNAVAVKVPALRSPLEGQVLEIGKRCALCYGRELADMAMQSLGGILESLRKEGVEVATIEQQLEAIERRMAAKDAWRDLEPLVLELAERLDERNPAMHRSGIREKLEQVRRWLWIRDAFLVLLRSDSISQGAVVPVAGIPTGQIWVLYDPLLPAGMGMVVNSWLMVCGTGGRGEIQVVQVSAAEGLGLPVGVGDPVPEMEEAEAASLAESIVISVPKDAGAPVSYVLNGRYPYTVEPGYKQKLPAGQNWVITFDRGNRLGTARYTLTRGYWEFEVVNNRWDLVKRSFEVTIDNRAGTQDFQYVVNNEVVTVKPGDAKIHHSADPVIVKFDRGEGPDSPSRKNLNKSGTYKVAVDTETNYLDLFASSESAAEPAPGPSG